MIGVSRVRERCLTRPHVSPCCTRIYCDDVPSPTVRMVAEVMSSPVVTTSPDDTVADAAALMRDRSVGSVVVVDGARPIGILTERDLVRLAAAGPAGDGTKVGEWMTADPDCVEPGLSVQEAVASLGAHGYSHIPR